MINKIVGFTISKNPINHSDVDVFNVGLSKKDFKHLGWNIYLWGKGDPFKCRINEIFSLSFPLNDSLLDRNILIGLHKDHISVDNDWLGAIPVFYNITDQIISTIPLKVFKNISIDEEGLYNYFEFGYCVFEHTAFDEVRFMRYFSSLIINNQGIRIEYKDDPALNDDQFTKPVDEKQVLQNIKHQVAEIESRTFDEIILPTSGGYDSRLLNYFIRDKSRIRSFTYGISKNQSESYEVVYAKKVSEILDTYWKHIQLGEYQRHLSDWFKLYGFSTHLHGMYHIEFYRKILLSYNFGQEATFLSGIFGDVWAGNVRYETVDNPSALRKLGYTHGLKLNMDYCLVNAKPTLKEQFYLKNHKLLALNNARALLTIRLKIVLISYLTQLPEYFGLPVWTPFLNYDIAMGMLRIHEKRRKHRAWQRDYFAQNSIDIESMHLKCNKSNTLDYEASKAVKLEQIEIDIMKKFVDKNHLHFINRKLKQANFKDDLKNKLLTIPKIRGICRLLRMNNEFLDCLYQYYVLKSIELSIKNEHC
jgi:hypothetical protein